MLLFIAERLHMGLTQVEQMSMREVNKWLIWFTKPAPTADDALDMHQLSQKELRSMFK